MDKVAKAIIAVLTAGLIALAAALTDGVNPGEWIVIALAVLGAIGVYSWPNTATPLQLAQARAQAEADVALQAEVPYRPTWSLRPEPTDREYDE